MKHTRTLAYVAEIARSGSIRRAAERLNIAPSALTRQVQDIEYEIGTPIFERLAQGMRLNAAGELLVRHARDQLADLERVRSQIADLSGVRRGHVALACSQAFVTQVVPEEVQAYREKFPQVGFTVQVRDHVQAVAALTAFEADLALVLQPPPSADLHVLYACRQPLCALMRAGHPLAREAGPVRLRDCLAHAMALPDRSLAIRLHLEQALARKGVPLGPVVEFELARVPAQPRSARGGGEPAGAERHPRRPAPRQPPDRRARPRPDGDDPRAAARGRLLSVAAAKFADQLTHSLDRRQADA